MQTDLASGRLESNGCKKTLASTRLQAHALIRTPGRRSSQHPGPSLRAPSRCIRGNAATSQLDGGSATLTATVSNPSRADIATRLGKVRRTCDDPVGTSTSLGVDAAVHANEARGEGDLLVVPVTYAPPIVVALAGTSIKAAIDVRHRAGVTACTVVPVGGAAFRESTTTPLSMVSGTSLYPDEGPFRQTSLMDYSRTGVTHPASPVVSITKAISGLAMTLAPGTPTASGRARVVAAVTSSTDTTTIAADGTCHEIREEVLDAASAFTTGVVSAPKDAPDALTGHGTCALSRGGAEAELAPTPREEVGSALAPSSASPSQGNATEVDCSSKGAPPTSLHRTSTTWSPVRAPEAAATPDRYFYTPLSSITVRIIH